MDQNEIITEINNCKTVLRDSDYVMLRSIEAPFEANTATKLLAAFVDTAREIKHIIDTRKQMRARINELEELLEDLNEQEAEPETEPQNEAEQE